MNGTDKLLCDQALMSITDSLINLVAQILPLLVKSNTIHFRIINQMRVNVGNSRVTAISDVRNLSVLPIYDQWKSCLITLSPDFFGKLNRRFRKCSILI